MCVTSLQAHNILSQRITKKIFYSNSIIVYLEDSLLIILRFLRHRPFQYSSYHRKELRNNKIHGFYRMLPTHPPLYEIQKAQKPRAFYRCGGR